MKKIIAVVMALTLAVMLPTLALAEMVEVNWFDVEAEVTEAGLEGDFWTLNAVAVKLWLPSVLEPEDVSDDVAAENGVIAAWSDADNNYSVIVQYIEGSEDLDMDALIAGIEGEGATDIERCVLNGLDAVSYTVPDIDSNIVVLLTESGDIVQFLFVPASDEDFEAMCLLITASIQPE